MQPLCELAGRAIELWAVQLSAPDRIVDRCVAMLSPDERARAERFRFEHHRRIYVLSRGILRGLLGQYTSIPPTDIRFSYGSKGKPNLVGVVPSIQFNSSTSGIMALYAITHNCDLGVDIEQIRALQEIEQVAGRFFCHEEARQLMSLSSSDRNPAFFHCWTRKEAYVKAVGDGLSMPLDSFRVTLMPGDPMEFIHIGNDPKTARQWTLHNFDHIPGYAAAMAYRDAPRPLRSGPIMTATEILTSLESL
jgi:4'-phosphopantetheinyl transferase